FDVVACTAHIRHIQSAPSNAPAPNLVAGRVSSARLNAMRLASPAFTGSASATTYRPSNSVRTSLTLAAPTEGIPAPGTIIRSKPLKTSSMASWIALTPLGTLADFSKRDAPSIGTTQQLPYPSPSSSMPNSTNLSSNGEIEPCSPSRALEQTSSRFDARPL